MPCVKLDLHDLHQHSIFINVEGIGDGCKVEGYLYSVSPSWRAGVHFLRFGNCSNDACLKRVELIASADSSNMRVKTMVTFLELVRILQLFFLLLLGSDLCGRALFSLPGTKSIGSVKCKFEENSISFISKTCCSKTKLLV